MKKLKYFSTLLIAIVAAIAVWLVWNYYMQSPWTRDGKVRAEQVGITPQVSGRIVALNARDNQLVKAGEELFRLDDTPYRIAVMNAEAVLEKANADLSRARSEADRRRNLPKNVISAEDLDTVNMALRAAKAASDVAKAQLEHARWQLSQTVVTAPVTGWVTNLSTRTGDYASVGHPVFALVDSQSFYVVGYFEETKLRHIRAGDPATIVLYSSGEKLQGHVSSIGRAIYDQSVGSEANLVADVKPTIPWVRLAQRIPVRVAFDHLPDNITLVAGTTCTIAIGGQ